MKWLISTTLLGVLLGAEKETGFVPLFPDEGVPKGWMVRHWADVKDPAPAGAVWKVEQGILHGSTPRGTWLVSEREYGDFILQFEFLLGPQGNSGCGIRFPLQGDPAFDALEVQMVDSRYYPPDMKVAPDELTGGLYKAMAPSQAVYKPEAWNRYVITCKGSRIQVELNGTQVVDLDLAQQEKAITRHNGQPAVPLKDRPRRGHIGFQELSRGGTHVQIRNARIREL